MFKKILLLSMLLAASISTVYSREPVPSFELYPMPITNVRGGGGHWISIMVTPEYLTVPNNTFLLPFIWDMAVYDEYGNNVPVAYFGDSLLVSPHGSTSVIVSTGDDSPRTLVITAASRIDPSVYASAALTVNEGADAFFEALIEKHSLTAPEERVEIIVYDDLRAVEPDSHNRLFISAPGDITVTLVSDYEGDEIRMNPYEISFLAGADETPRDVTITITLDDDPSVYYILTIRVDSNYIDARNIRMLGYTAPIPPNGSATVYAGAVSRRHHSMPLSGWFMEGHAEGDKLAEAPWGAVFYAGPSEEAREVTVTAYVQGFEKTTSSFTINVIPDAHEYTAAIESPDTVFEAEIRPSDVREFRERHHQETDLILTTNLPDGEYYAMVFSHWGLWFSEMVTQNTRNRFRGPSPWGGGGLDDVSPWEHIGLTYEGGAVESQYITVENGKAVISIYNGGFLPPGEWYGRVEIIVPYGEFWYRTVGAGFTVSSY